MVLVSHLPGSWSHSKFAAHKCNPISDSPMTFFQVTLPQPGILKEAAPPLPVAGGDLAGGVLCLLPRRLWRARGKFGPQQSTVFDVDPQ
jgi:hypothetical protein